ncbi:MAG: J domain-containing protein [Okeania sp. SIO2F4]|uniref:J domain-containing protein n=1 Tax=Microcoleaceae TaxID=1892252 RepID=UPI00142AE150|nr:J domain-containing protein [Okeania sp. SIO2F4]MDJ0519069.1 J domain-containing protein [Trichodesmium sp. MO_231.B1]NES04295.1 J domain-containing protein [Okeania sp. SIO2F4]
MNIADYYRQLGLNLGATLGEVKASYRRLARMYHPDVNPKDRQAKDKFIAVTEAYKILVKITPAQTELAYNSTPTSTTNKNSKSETVSSQTTAPRPTKVRVNPKQEQDKNQSHTSEVENQLKQNYYLQLKQLLKYKRYPLAITLVEGLAQRMPQDWEVRQWQAIAYQRWARHLISERKLDKARNYLKKALKTDPQNRALWAEVEHDFRQLEKIY